jgi:acetoin utilization deacetylase AcuC-like enzyme
MAAKTRKKRKRRTMLIFHDPRCAQYGSGAHPEQPARVRETAAYLRSSQPSWAWRKPSGEIPDEILLLAHTPGHLERLAEPRDFDADTPHYAGIAEHARRSVASAVEAVEHAFHLARPAPVFSLMRPPGHHATSSRAMGFCYLNQVAIAALAARERMGAQRVAVWDFDAHHGNGTEEILLKRKGFLYCSVHQYPAYPGTGAHDLGNSRNWPVAPGTPRPAHMADLQASWDAVLGFRPDLVLVSAGFDAYAQDPITDMTLEAEDFATLGHWLHQSGLPIAAVLEGGYSPDLPELIEAFLRGWEME